MGLWGVLGKQTLVLSSFQSSFLSLGSVAWTTAMSHACPSPPPSSASFVDDGICDCCDGTDELKGCSNTCLDKSAGALLSLQQKVAAYGNTLAKKASYVKQAAERRKSWATRTHTIDSEIAAKFSQVEVVRGGCPRRLD